MIADPGPAEVGEELLAFMRDALARGVDAVRRHGAFDLVEAAEPAGDVRARFERDAGRCGGRKLERPERGDAQVNGGRGCAVGPRGDRDAADLRHHLDEDDGGNNRLAREVPLEKEVAGGGRAPRRRALAVHDLDHLLEQTHRRPVRQGIDQGHRA